MARVVFNGAPGEVFTNDTGKVLFQLVCLFANSCGVCISYARAVGPSWPIPLHRSCRCRQRPVLPGKDALPFVDFMAEIRALPESQQAVAVGKANWRLIEKGVVGFDDVVTPQRVRTLREVVSRGQLDVATLLKAGVNRRVAEDARAAVHTPPHELAAAHRRALVDALTVKGVGKEELRTAFGQRVAGRVGIVSGPGGAGGMSVAPPPPGASGIGRADATGAVLRSLGVKPAAAARGEWLAFAAEQGARAEAALPDLRTAVVAAKRDYQAVRSLPDSGERRAAEQAYFRALAEEERARRRVEDARVYPERLARNPNLLPPGPIAARLALYEEGDRKIEALKATGVGSTEDLYDRRKRVFRATRDLESSIANLEGRFREVPKKQRGDVAARLESERAALGRAAADLERLKAEYEAAAARAPEAAAGVIGLPPERRARFSKRDVAPGTVVATDAGDRFAAEPLSGEVEGHFRAAHDWLGRVTAKGAVDAIEAEAAGAPGLRAHWNDRDGRMVVASDRVALRTVIHEYGHAIDARLGDNCRVAAEFLHHRVGNEPFRDLGELDPSLAGEWGRKDRFDSVYEEAVAYYAGKEYGAGGADGTEIVSLGVELLHRDPVKFAEKDPEWCKLILGVLDGALR